MNPTVIAKCANASMPQPEPTGGGPSASEHYGGVGWFAALVALLLDVGRGCALGTTGPDLSEGGAALPAARAERLSVPDETLVTEAGAGAALALDPFPGLEALPGSPPSAPPVGHPGPATDQPALHLDKVRGSALPLMDRELLAVASGHPAPNEGMPLPPSRPREAVGEEGPLPGDMLLRASADKPSGPAPMMAGEQSPAAKRAASAPLTPLESLEQGGTRRQPFSALPGGGREEASASRSAGRDSGYRPGIDLPVTGQRQLTAAAEDTPGPTERERAPIAPFDLAGVRQADATDPAGPNPAADAPPPVPEGQAGEAWAALRARITELDPQRQSIRLAMDPEGLGAMQLEVSLTAEGARASFEVSDPAAGQVLTDRQADLRQALEGVGVRLNSVDVRLGDSAGRRGGATSAPDDPAPAAPDIRLPAPRLPAGAGDLSRRSLLDYRV